MDQPYSTRKILHHPEALEAMRSHQHQNPIQIHYMPMLKCNQKCKWCSYGHRDSSDGPESYKWKNMALMSDDHMPREKMYECMHNWKEMGVKAIELTGGGEPLIYLYVDEFLSLASRWGVDLALVTNGTALTSKVAQSFGQTHWKWARVSIDAGDPETYMRVRRVPRNHWKLAWDAVERLADLRRESEQRVGVGYVVDANNFLGVYAACALAERCGADNIRISLAFTPQNMNRFPPEAIEEASRLARMAAKEFEGRLQVIDLVSERAKNIVAATQDYSFCGVKEVLCVVGGDQRVYTCCSLAFNPKGLIGSIASQSFRDLWWSPETLDFFQGHDACKVCNIPCLYERRNKEILGILEMPSEQLPQAVAKDTSIHRNFI